MGDTDHIGIVAAGAGSEIRAGCAGESIRKDDAGSRGGRDYALRFAGYAAVFDRADRGGDIVRRGAFQGQSTDIPILWQHEPGAVIGQVEYLYEDAHGLRIIGRLCGGTQGGREAGALLKTGAMKGLSFGYRIKAAGQKKRGNLRELLKLDLIEISVVTFPMQPLARVHAVEELRT